MAKKILIFGRTGSGKTTLAKALAPLIGAVIMDGDAVRDLDPVPTGWTSADRWLHAKRMSGLCDAVTASGNNAIASFVCPKRAHRHEFAADFAIWMDRNGDGKYPDTQAMFDEPGHGAYDLRCTNDNTPQYWAAAAAAMIQPVFNPMRGTALFVGRYQPFHAGHKALIEAGIKKYGQVCIGVRDQNREWPFSRVRQLIEFGLREHVGQFSVIALPNITAVCYGRDVGYQIEQLPLPPEIEKISGTEIRTLSDGQLRPLLRRSR